MSFLRSVFGVDESHRMFQEDVLRWKCFAPHPFWEGSRGFALRYQGAIAAFGCMVPCRFLTGSGTVISCNMIDWAASRAVPSAGVLLYRHIRELTGTMINIGGTSDARKVLPKIGFDARLERHSYARVLRPWGNFLQASQKDWKSPLRLARDVSQLVRPALDPRRLKARRVDRFDGMPVEAFPDPAITHAVVPQRTAASLGYSLACPAAEIDGYVLEQDGADAGYFLLSRPGSDCRIADLWIRSADQDLWAEAYAIAADVAGSDQRITQIRVAVSSPMQIAALEKAAFRRSQTDPVFVLDPGKMLCDRADLALSLLENDGYYWKRD